MSEQRGRHRRRYRISVVGLVAGLVLMTAATAGAMLSPVLTERPLADGSPSPSTVVDRSSPPAARSGARPTSTPELTATPTPTTAPPKPKPTTRSTAAGLVGFEDEVFRLTNVERGKAGCGALHLDTRLRQAARDHSADMARNDYFSHTSQDGSTVGDRLARAGYPKNVGWAENIAYGYPTPAAVMTGWMNSAGHRANILNCGLRALGVGAAKDPNGRIYWTQDFGGV